MAQDYTDLGLNNQLISVSSLANTAPKFVTATQLDSNYEGIGGAQVKSGTSFGSITYLNVAVGTVTFLDPLGTQSVVMNTPLAGIQGNTQLQISPGSLTSQIIIG